MRTLTLLLLALVLVVGAATVTFQPDATVGKDAPCTKNDDGDQGRNFGNSPTMGCGSFHSHFYDEYCRAYIEFTELNDSAYQGATVASASLWLYVYSTESVGSAHYLGVVDSEWDEDTITYNNSPGLITGSVFYSCGNNSWLEVDVTGYVQKWLDGTWENYGFVATEDGTYRLWCYSSDYTGDPTRHPKLVLNYSGAAVEEATWGEIKATF